MRWLQRHVNQNQFNGCLFEIISNLFSFIKFLKHLKKNKSNDTYFFQCVIKKNSNINFSYIKSYFGCVKH